MAIGSNLAHGRVLPGQVVALALDLLEEHDLISILAASRPYRSAAFPPGSGPDFVNAAAAVETGLGPEALLGALHDVEARLGRVRERRWEPRVVDLDLVAVDDRVLPDRATEARWRALPADEAARSAPDRLILPHPRMAERAFVLAPLSEVAPDWRHPALGLTVGEMLERLGPAARAGVTPLPALPRVLRRLDLGPGGRASTTRHEVGGRAVGRIQGLEIVRLPGARGVELRYLDARGREITDTWHRHLDDALAQAETEFGVAPADWTRPAPGAGPEDAA